MAKGSERLPGTSNRLRTRDDGCCSVNFLKYVLHIYNVVLFVSFKNYLFIPRFFDWMIRKNRQTIKYPIIFRSKTQEIYSTVVILINEIRNFRCKIKKNTYIVIINFYTFFWRIICL